MGVTFITSICTSSGIAEVLYNVTYLTASADDVRLTPSGGVVTFAPGATQANINVRVLDDVSPEEQEQLMLTLVAVISGDAVLFGLTQANLVIELSDDPNGLFAFDEDSLSVMTVEGDSIQLR